MLKLRLSRGGTKKRPVYKVVVADSRFARDGRFIEKVGFFNPLLPKEKKERVGLEAERIKYWLGQGAQPTTRVARILGEKIENLEVFHPDRIANRILGMGDIVSLVEKAAQDLGEENIKKAEENLKKGQFSMQDYLTQLRQMKKMGGIEGIMSFMPGVSKMKSQMDSAGIDESIITKNEAIILSMTKKERENPKLIDGSRKKRIANGSGTDPATINKLLKQFKMMSEMMKKMSKGNLKGMSDKGIPPELFNQLK